jgi:hypothetical protein
MIKKCHVEFLVRLVSRAHRALSFVKPISRTYVVHCLPMAMAACAADNRRKSNTDYQHYNRLRQQSRDLDQTYHGESSSCDTLHSFLFCYIALPICTPILMLRYVLFAAVERRDVMRKIAAVAARLASPECMSDCVSLNSLLFLHTNITLIIIHVTTQCNNYTTLLYSRVEREVNCCVTWNTACV